jgi:uncharacterized caspase-like protein
VKTTFLDLRFHVGLTLALLGLVPIYFVSESYAIRQVENRGLEVPLNGSVSNWPSSAKRYALVIGVDQYDDNKVGQLKGAANDAKTLAKVLEKNAGFPTKQIVLLTSDQTGDRRSTRANILREMSDLSSTVPKDGLLLVAFAGHGMERGQQVFLLPSDAQVKNLKLLEQTAVPATLIADWFRTKVQQVLIIIDACRSYPGAIMGAVFGGFKGAAVGAAIGFNGINMLTQALKLKSMDERNREIVAFAILYATESGRQAYEDAKRQQGYLTGAVVRGLEGEAANKEGDVTLAALVKYVQEAVPKVTKSQIGNEQRPFYSIEGYKADELVIAVIRQ